MIFKMINNKRDMQPLQQTSCAGCLLANLSASRNVAIGQHWSVRAWLIQFNS